MAAADPAHSQAGLPRLRLESWKEIAAYLRRSVRTVRRWERLEGLPVHRHTHNQRATVYSFQPDLDLWIAARTRNGDSGRQDDRPRDMANTRAATLPTPIPLKSHWPSRRALLLAAFGLAAAYAIYHFVFSGPHLVVLHF